MVKYTYNPNYLGGPNRRIVNSRPAQKKIARPYLKNEMKAKGLEEKKKEKERYHLSQAMKNKQNNKQGKRCSRQKEYCQQKHRDGDYRA